MNTALLWFRPLALAVVAGLMFSSGLMAGDRTARRANTSISFDNDIMPLLSRAGCNTTRCHGSTTGKGGLRLSMFGADARHDYLAITRAGEGRRVNPVEPLESLVLLKATRKVPHGGEQPLKPDSAEEQILVAWLSAGCPRDDASGRKLESLSVSPSAASLALGERRAMAVTAVFSDGTRRDVSRWATYQSLDTAVVQVSAEGAVSAGSYGATHVLASYNRCTALARFVVPQPLPGPFPEAAAANPIDALVLAKLKEVGIPASGMSTDEEFVRRVFLDTIGTLPSVDEVRSFLADGAVDKREKLVDALLNRPEFADFWALKWGDLLRIKAEYPSNLWPNAVQAYHRWIRDAIARDKPYDAMVRELLVATGSNFRDPPCNFYRATESRTPQGFAESAALVFMGARMDCARCHAHPTESWTLEDGLGMAAFFSQIKFKSTKEWKEEIVYRDRAQRLTHPATGAEISPKLLDGPVVAVDENEDPRQKLAQWLTAPENPWFARNVVNRIWYWLLGRGIVHEPDDMRSTNPPSNPELLAFLEKQLVANGFRLKPIYRLILTSSTYGRSSLTHRWNAADQVFFSHYPLKRLTAEQLSDAIGEITLNWDEFSSQIPEPYSRWPAGFRATQMADGSVGTPFLELFGRPPRDTAYESDRDCRASMRQALYLVTSADFQAKIARSPRIQQWLKDHASDAAVIDELFYLALSRQPTSDERQLAGKHLAAAGKGRAQAIQDLMWALLNTKEFMFNH